MKTTTTTSSIEADISDWKSDEILLKWQQKISEVSTRLTQTEDRQETLDREIEQTEQAIIQSKSLVILEEGSDEDVARHKNTLESLRKEQSTLNTEVEALQLAKSRIQGEITDAEKVAKARALDAFRPLLEDKSNALLLALEATQKLNQELKELETQLTSKELRQQHGWMQQTIAIENIPFPSGIPEFQKHVEARIRQLFKD